MSFYFEEPSAAPGVTFAPGGEADLGSLWSAARESMVLLDNSNSAETALERAYDARIAAIKEATGEELENPLRRAVRPPRATGQGGDLGTRAQYLAEFETRRAALLKKHPGAADAIAPGRRVEDDALELARAADADFARLAASRGGLGKWAAVMGGGMAGSLRDPMQVATLMLGGGPGAARSTFGAIARVALKEALINAAAEGAIQPSVQAWRQKAGLDAGFDVAMRNMLFAGLAGGALGGAGEGLARGLGRAFAGPETGLPDADLARALPEGAPARKAMEGDPEALAAVVRDLPEPPPEVRGGLAAKEADDAIVAARPADVTPEAHDARMADALRVAEEDSAYEAAASALFKEHQKGRPKRPKGVSPDLVTFLQRRGGIRDDDGELSARDLDKFGRLARKGGMSLARATELARDFGYLRETEWEGGVAKLTEQDLLDAIDRNEAGERVYPVGEDRRWQYDQDRAAWQAQRDEIGRALSEIRDSATDPLPAHIIERAAVLRMTRESADVADALERAIMEDYYAGGDLGPGERITNAAGEDIPFDTGGSAGERGAVEGPGQDGGAGQGAPDEFDGFEPDDPRGLAGEEPPGIAPPEGGIDVPGDPEAVALAEQILRDTLETDGERVVMLAAEDDAERVISKGYRFKTALDEAERPAKLALAVRSCKT